MGNMDFTPNDYDPRYLAGILFFNAEDFFEAHEVWEDLWHVTPPPRRRFYQALIQAAVAMYHLGNRNLRGAIKLYHSSHNYMQPYAPVYLGLDVPGFWAAMARRFGPLAACQVNTPDLPSPDPGPAPKLKLDPEPMDWPNPHDFLAPDAAEGTPR